MRKTVAERFWDKVDKTGECWLWTGARRRAYGYVGNGKGKVVDAQRLAWEITFGEIPEGLYVLHKCDNPQCVRPSHLFLGTARDNTLDMVAKGRHKGGAPVGHPFYGNQNLKK